MLRLERRAVEISAKPFLVNMPSFEYNSADERINGIPMGQFKPANRQSEASMVGGRIAFRASIHGKPVAHPTGYGKRR